MYDTAVDRYCRRSQIHAAAAESKKNKKKEPGLCAVCLLCSSTCWWFFFSPSLRIACTAPHIKIPNAGLFCPLLLLYAAQRRFSPTYAPSSCISWTGNDRYVHTFTTAAAYGYYQVLHCRSLLQQYQVQANRLVFTVVAGSET